MWNVCLPKKESKRKLNAARNVCFNALKRQILREERELCDETGKERAKVEAGEWERSAAIQNAVRDLTAKVMQWQTKQPTERQPWVKSSSRGEERENGAEEGRKGGREKGGRVRGSASLLKVVFVRWLLYSVRCCCCYNFWPFFSHFCAVVAIVVVAAEAINNESSLPAGFALNVFTAMSNATGQQQQQQQQ